MRKKITIHNFDGGRKHLDYSNGFPNHTIIQDFVENEKEQSLLMTLCSPTRVIEPKYYFLKIGDNLYSKAIGKSCWLEVVIPNFRNFDFSDGVTFCKIADAQAGIYIREIKDFEELFSSIYGKEETKEMLQKLIIFTEKIKFREYAGFNVI